MNDIKTFIIPSNEMNIEIMRDCLNTSNSNINFSNDYIRKVILNTRKNRDNTKMVIFYRGVKPNSCIEYNDIDWSKESQTSEWNNMEEY